MARSRSKQTHSRRASASSSYHSGRSHNGDAGLAKLLKIMEHNYISQTIDGLIPVLDSASGNVDPKLVGTVPGINFYKPGPSNEYVKFQPMNAFNQPMVDAAGNPIYHYKLNPIPKSTNPAYFWDKFSTAEIQAALLTFTAQKTQLIKLDHMLELYSENVKATIKALEDALTNKYKETEVLNKAIVDGLGQGKLPLQTIIEQKKAKKIKDLKESLTKRQAAIQTYLNMIPGSP